MAATVEDASCASMASRNLDSPLSMRVPNHTKPGNTRLLRAVTVPQ
jgi:hypothetical protein